MALEGEKGLPWREEKKIHLLINFPITSRMALSDGAPGPQRNGPGLHSLRGLFSDLV